MDIQKISGLRIFINHKALCDNGFPEGSVPKDSAHSIQGCKHQNVNIQGHSSLQGVTPGVPIPQHPFLLSLLCSSKKVPIPLSPGITSLSTTLLLLCYFRIKSAIWVVKQMYTYLNFHWSVNLMKCYACMHSCNYHQIQDTEHSQHTVISPAQSVDIFFAWL